MNGKEFDQIVNHHNPFIPGFSEERDSTITSKIKQKNCKGEQRQMEQRVPYSLEKLITKPPYVTVSNGNRLIGNFGHSTVVFKRPIIEGKYFLQFIIREDAKIDK